MSVLLLWLSGCCQGSGRLHMVAVCPICLPYCLVSISICLLLATVLAASMVAASYSLGDISFCCPFCMSLVLAGLCRWLWCCVFGAAALGLCFVCYVAPWLVVLGWCFDSLISWSGCGCMVAQGSSMCIIFHGLVLFEGVPELQFFGFWVWLGVGLTFLEMSLAWNGAAWFVMFCYCSSKPLELEWSCFLHIGAAVCNPWLGFLGRVLPLFWL
ncbi:hypothetical protein U1Q18_017314 [Sarracenia purpurea var. burkii]